MADAFDALSKAIADYKPPDPPASLAANPFDVLKETIDAQTPVIKKQLFEQRQQRMQQPITAPPGQTATAAALGTLSGLVKGIFSPVSAFMPDAFNDKLDAWEEDSVRKQLGMIANSEHKTAYQASPTVTSFLSRAPGTVGEITGSLVPFIPGYEAARTAFKVGEAASTASMLSRSVAAAGTTGGLFAAGARLDPGESRWAKVATDSAMMGSFEIVGIPAMLKAWKEESPLLSKAVPKELEPEITAIRAGVPASDEAIDTVLDHAKENPEEAKKPVVLQAAKQKQARQKIQAPKTTIDPLLEGNSANIAAQVQVTVEGQPTTINVTKDPANFQHLSNQVDQVVNTVKNLAQQGADVSVDSVTAGSAEDAKAVLDGLQGKKAKAPNPDRKKRKVPGAAPPASVAENGNVPTVGSDVTVKEPDKPPVKGKVVKLAESSSLEFDQLMEALHPGETAPRINPQGYGTQKVVEFDPIEAKLKKISGEMDPEVIKDNFNIHQEGLEWAKLHGTADDIEDAGMLRDEALDRYRQLFNRESDWGVKNPGGKAQPNLSKLTAAQKADRYAKMKDSTVPVEMPDKTVRLVPLAQLQVPLEVKANASEHLKPHLDGSDRHGIIHLDDKDLSLEPLGASKQPEQNLFRTELFSNKDLDQQWGKDPRLLIHDDGVTIKPTTDPSVNDVTMKRAARVLIDKGVAADTVEKSTGKTLKALYETELPLADLGKLQDDAAERGLSAIPQGSHILLKSKNGFTKEFTDSLSAHEAVLRIPPAQVNKKVEADLESAWRIGSERAFDPDVDVSRYLPVAQQEQGVTDLIQGKRPLVPVYTTDTKALIDTVKSVENAMGVKPGTLKVQLLPAMDDGKRKAATLYNEDLVALQAAKNRPSLNYLGVTAKDPAAILQQLSTKGQGHGIYVLAGRDAESAALYAHYRDNGAKELWEKGRLESDALGPYRRFSKTHKAVVSYPGAGDEFVPADLSDIQSAPEVNFKPDSGSKPRPVEEMAPYEPDLSFGQGFPRWSTKVIPGVPSKPPGEFTDTSGPISKVFGLRFRPMMEMSKDLQTKTGVPFYDWYRAIEVARNKVEQEVNPILGGVNDLAKQFTREERKQIQLLFESRVGDLPGTADIEKKVSERVKTGATALEQTYNDFFHKHNFSDEDITDFFRIFPSIRKADGDFRTATKGMTKIPKLANLLSKEMNNGTIMLDDRELDFQRIANRVIRSTASERYLQPSWNNVATEFQAFAEAKRIPDDYGHVFGRYMSEVLHMPDPLAKSLAKGTRQIFDRLGMKMSEIESQDAVQMFTQMSAFANMAWRPSIVLRDMFQTLQTSLPIIGARDTLEGWRFGLRWYKDPKLQEEMVKRGVIQPNAIYQPLQEVSRLFEGSGVVNKALDTFFNKGTKWNADGHNFSHVVAYWGQYQRALRVGQEYLEKKIDFPTFMEKSRLDMRDAPNGPFVQQIKGLLGQGNLEGAASRGAEEFSKSTQYLYTRGNAPYVMQSTLGRFLLQYGTWPAWYAENLRNMLVRGSWKNRTAALARWGAVQTAMFGTANALFGVDLARWTFFAPLGYAGGPATQLLTQGADVWKGIVDPSDNDPVAKIAKARMASTLIRQVAPFPIAAARDTIRAISSINGGSWQDAARMFVNLPPAKGSIMQ